MTLPRPDAQIPPEAGPDWPPPVEVLNEEGRSPFVLLCEHASVHVPREYRQLGLDEAELRRHIGWDIGAAEVTRRLAERLDAPAFLGTYSRLLIDLNRPLAAASSMPARSELTEIPGNVSLTPAEIRRRADTMFAPFHARVAAHLDQRRRQGRETILATIHSFTPVYKGVARPWHCGILFGASEAYAGRILGRLARDTTLNVAANQPYEITAEEDYAIPIHGDARGLPAVLVEIRNDLIDTPAGAALWADRLAESLPDR